MLITTSECRYERRVLTARRRQEIIGLKKQGVRPSEIASRLGIGRATGQPTDRMTKLHIPYCS